MTTSSNPENVCELCGAESRLVEEHDGVMLCVQCMDDEHPQCARCGERVEADHKSLNGEPVCLRCYERRLREGGNARNDHVFSKTWDDLGAIDAVGVEIECWPKDSTAISRMYADHGREMVSWRQKHDGSLGMNGVEFISPPVPVREAKRFFKSCRWMSQYVEANSQRAGLHVHANLRPYILSQSATAEERGAIVRRLLHVTRNLEDFMMLTQPQSRRDNTYCRRLTREMRSDTTLLMTDAQLGSDAGFWGRYTWVNFAAITRHNTVECRIHSGTASLAKIRVWASIWSKVVRYAMTAPLEAVERISPATLGEILSAEELAYMKGRIEKFNPGMTMDLAASRGVSRMTVRGAAQASRVRTVTEQEAADGLSALFG